MDRTIVVQLHPQPEMWRWSGSAAEKSGPPFKLTRRWANTYPSVGGELGCDFFERMYT